ncbi:MAG: PilN domain-containing protein [Chloroflexota bacterium]
MLKFKNILFSFFKWWITQILPSSATKNFDKATASQCIVLSTNGGVFYENDIPNETPVSIDEAVNLIKQTSRNKDRSVSIVLDETRYLYKRVSAKKLPDYRILELAELDVVSQTPFSRDDVHLVSDSSNGSGTGYFIVKKSIIDPVFERMKRERIPVEGLFFSGYFSEGLLPVNQYDFASSGSSIIRKIFNGGALLACVLSIITVGHFYWRYDQANALLDQQLTQVNQEVKQVRSNLASQRALNERLNGILDLKKSSVSTVEIWEEFSRIMPDDSWLSILSIKGNQVEISGYSRTASSLIKIVDSSPFFHQAGFDGPVVTIAGRNVQRFVIQAILEK